MNSMIFFLFLWLLHVRAAPTGATDSLRSRANDKDSGLAPQIWVPVLIVVVAFTFLAIFYGSKRSARLRNWMHRRGAASSATTPVPAAGARELTAEQLAGGSARNTTTAERPRRTRRPRRTPSQMSTTSLPAYMKEPGEQELVIFRGPLDMEDGSIPIEMPLVEEDGEDSMHSRDNSESSAYTPIPHSPNSMPLLQSDDGSTDPSSHYLQPPGDLMPVRQSIDTIASSAETGLLMPTSSDTPASEETDPRGAAPAYFEVVDLSHDQVEDVQRGNNVDPPAPAPPTVSQHQASPSEQSSNNRRSTLRTFFGGLGTSNRMPHADVLTPVQAPTHVRGDSLQSMSTEDHGIGPSRSRISTHRPTLSGSGSVISNFRLSRKKSTNTLHSNNLTSPSMISLNSISAPLTHTLTRTEFTYPKSGPTPEQLKLISSRESFARFGMPYGRDAIAFAASASRQDLLPPPDFEEVARPGSSTSILPTTSADISPDTSLVVDHTPVSAEVQTTDSTALGPSSLSLPQSNEAPRSDMDVHAPFSSSPLASTTSDAPLSSNAPPTSFKSPASQQADLGLGASPGSVPGGMRAESRASSYMSVASYATAAESISGQDTPTTPEHFSDSEPTTPTTPRTPTTLR